MLIVFVIHLPVAVMEWTSDMVISTMAAWSIETLVAAVDVVVVGVLEEVGLLGEGILTGFLDLIKGKKLSQNFFGLVTIYYLFHISLISGVKPTDKRDGAGAHNWGTFKDGMTYK